MSSVERMCDGASEARTFAEVLQLRAAQEPRSRAYSFLDRTGEVSEDLSHGQLHRAAGGLAVRLRAVTNPGDRVLVVVPPGLSFVTALFGCWYAGVIPVPALPPEGAGAKLALPRLAIIVKDAGCRVGVTTESMSPRLNQLDSSWARPGPWVHIDRCADVDWSAADIPALAEGTALLQYTSGSTGTPKGVVLTHQNLLANSEHIRRAFGHQRASQGVIWLPPQHDMGLVGGILQPIFAGFPVVLMSPMTFLQRPIRWLEAISRYRATTSGGPDFAYRMCAERIAPEEREGLDLSCWDVAFTGSESVRASTIDAFCEAFGAHGFRRKAFFPCYGLAEATLMVTGPERLTGPRVLHADRTALGAGIWRAGTAGDAGSVALTSCGAAMGEQTVAIVTPGTDTVVPEGTIGEVVCQGTNVARGYWGQEESSRETFGLSVADRGAGFLRTGDLGFLEGGELFITGRAKDLIIVRGRNHFPGDIEATLDEVLLARGVPTGAIGVFADPLNGESVTAAVELRGTREKVLERADEVAETCRQALGERHGIAPERIVLLRPGAIPRTTSGKVRRSVLQGELERGEIRMVREVRFPARTPPAWRPAASDPPTTTREVIAWLVDHAARKRGVDRSEIDTRAPFTSYGFDSLEAVTLASELADWVRRPITATALWEHPNIEQLARFVCPDEPTTARVVSRDVAGAIDGNPEARPGEAELRDKDVAIVGVACRVPGATDPEQFWELLLAGQRATRLRAPRRPGAEALDQTGLGAGYLEDVDEFDAPHFEISPDEARAMDPQQRLLLECAWEGLESAGVDPRATRGRRVGVFVGISNVDYARSFGGDFDSGVFAGTGNALSVAANRLSYTFDWNGPSLAVDTACSSSLVAVHLACRSLLANECDLALAAGVNLILAPELTKIFQNAGMLSSTSRCRPFERDADGYVRGEGCGVVVLKPAARARADGDHIFAVVRGSFVNQDGRSNGLTAPNAGAQRACIAGALRAAGVRGDEVDFLEAHGTGTPLGDPIEVGSLSELLARDAESAPCLLGSVKSNIGHLESAAGIIGLIKAALVVGRGVVPPQPELGPLNDRLALPEYLAVPRTPVSTSLRYAGVSSFGFGGTNAHVVLEAPSEVQQTSELAAFPWILSLSARTPRALRSLAERYRATIEAGGDRALVAIRRVCLTRRSRLAERVFVVGSTRDELLEGLRALERGEDAPDLVLRERLLEEEIWVCGELHSTEERLPHWNCSLPGLSELFSRYLAAAAPSGEGRASGEERPMVGDGADRSFAASCALVESLGRLGWSPRAMTGHGAGEIVAAAWACELSPFQAGQLWRYVRGRTDEAPMPVHVSLARRFVSSAGVRHDRLDPCELRRRYESAAGMVVSTVEEGLRWAAGPKGTVLEQSRSGHQGRGEGILRCLARADLAGAAIDWGTFLEGHGDEAARMPSVSVPTYPFDRSSYWHEEGARPKASCCTLVWRSQTVDVLDDRPGRWLYVGVHERLSSELELEIRARGGELHVVQGSKEAASLLASDCYDGVLIRARDEGKHLEASLFELVQFWRGLEKASCPPRYGLRVWTEGAYDESSRAGVTGGVDPGQTAVWGLVRTLVNESPGARIQLIDVRECDGPPGIRSLADELVGTSFEHVLLRGDRRLVARLVEDHAALSGRSAPCTEGTIVVSGGLGALGVALAERLTELGARSLVLLGRDAERNRDRVAELRRRGVDVRTVALDVTDGDRVQALFRELRESGRRVTGIVHAAGVLRDGVMERQTPPWFAEVLGPKVAGLENLYAASQGSDLEFFCLVSSLAGILGAPGQGAYGAANSYLDGAAELLRSRGVPAVAVALGPVEDTDMVGTGVRAAGALGLRPLPLAAAVDAIVDAAAQPNLPWRLMTARGSVEPGVEPGAAPFSTQIRRLTEDWLQEVGESSQGELLRSLAAGGERRSAVLRDWIRARVAEALHAEPSTIDTASGLLDLGLDSLMILQLRSRIQAELGLRVPPTVLFERPTIDGLTDYLLDSLRGAPGKGGTRGGDTTLREGRRGMGASVEARSAPADLVGEPRGDFLSALEEMDERTAQQLIEEG